MQEVLPRVAVLGAGYWGKNLVRNFHELGALELVCDPDPAARRETEQRHSVRTVADAQDAFRNPQIQAVIIAAPAAQHYELAKKALVCGKDVFVEKPLALRVNEGEELVQLAKQGNAILMVGHILEYHPAIVELRNLIRSGELGRIQYIYSSRLNLGKLRTEENILWSFAPHDISAILFLLDEAPTHVASHGGSYLNAGVFDTTMTTCEFKSGVRGHIFVSWLHPFKEQRLTVVGGRKMAVFDDTEPERKLMLYSHRINWLDRVPVAQKEEGQVVPLPVAEPLRKECEHFLNCVASRETPRSSGESALRVLRVLEACETSLRDGRKPVAIETRTPRYVAHASAVIDEGCQIGEGTKIWHFSHIMGGSRIGSQCNLGQNVVVSPGVSIGNNVKIQNNVSVYTGVELEDDVFCGPSMVFTNVINPRSHVPRKDEYRRTLVKKGASIGANATVVCGVTLGRYCFVAAGAVVTRDVADHALVKGVPARRTGWVCSCGLNLAGNGPEYLCACGRSYAVANGSCCEIPAEDRDLMPRKAA